ncbi:uncharacterized protein LOC128393375 [Panonychus citri]|uniref:uncharacterized protein LOC128393375 n=1 Tax=Panonychus citri TaxID=50023 RepID=UPI002307676E|nr:uncharacterized protein LOC128393375 [Panonychus citri]
MVLIDSHKPICGFTNSKVYSSSSSSLSSPSTSFHGDYYTMRSVNCANRSIFKPVNCSISYYMNWIVNILLKVIICFILIPIIILPLSSSSSSLVQSKRQPPGINLMKGPWFEEEPSDTLIVNQPVSLKCKVHDVLSAQFHCNHGHEEDIRKRTTSQNYVDPETGQLIFELTLNVNKSDIDYFTNSLASITADNSDHHGLLSDEMLPSSSSSSFDHLLNLHHSDHSSDKLVYKCWCTAFGGASRVNIDSRKASVQFSCFNCDDDSAEIPNCYKICGPVDGQWSPWTSWSTCSHDCQQFRHRTCTNPPAKYGGRDCPGPESHVKNCTGGLCRKLGEFQLTRSEEDSQLQYPKSSSASPSDDRKPEIYILCFVIAISTALICLAVFIYVLMSQRRYKQPGSMIGDDGGCEEDGQTMLLLMQQQKQQNQQQQLQQQFNLTPQHTQQAQQSSQSEYIYSNESIIPNSVSPEEKMHLISRLNAYNGNIIDHLVVRRDALRANCPTIETTSLNQTPSHHSISSQLGHQSIGQQQQQQQQHQQTMYVTRSSPSPASCCNTNSSTPRLGKMSSRSGATPPSSSSGNTTVTATSEDENYYESEADYAEPFVSNFSLFTPERKPPLPSTRPPSARTDDHASENNLIRANNDNRPQQQQQQQQSTEPSFLGETLFLRSATKWR